MVEEKKVVCEVYKSTKLDGAYLYLKKNFNFEELPSKLMETFGEPKYVMTFLLTPEKKLAQVEAKEVLGKLEYNGYFLQLTREVDEYMQKINQYNSKLR